MNGRRRYRKGVREEGIEAGREVRIKDFGKGKKRWGGMDTGNKSGRKE